MESTDYQAQYDAACNCMDDIAMMLVEDPGGALALALQAGGPQAAQALFDAAIDCGWRKALVATMNGAELDDAVREQLQLLACGSFGLTAVLVQQLN